MGSARWCIRFMVGMVYVNGQGEVYGPRARARVRFRFFESCKGRLLVRLD